MHSQMFHAVGAAHRKYVTRSSMHPQMFHAVGAAYNKCVTRSFDFIAQRDTDKLEKEIIDNTFWSLF